MFLHRFKKDFFKQWIAYFSLFCVVFTSQIPSKLLADPCSCIMVDQEDARRTKIATVVAGATVLALVGGVAWLAFGSSGRKHHHSSSSSSYSSYSSYSYRSYSSDYSSDSPWYSDRSSHSSSPYSHDSNSSGSRSSSSPWYSDYSPSHYYTTNPYSIFGENNVSSFYGGSTEGIGDIVDQQRFEDGLPFQGKRVMRTKKSIKESSDQLSGVFVTHPALSVSNQGRMIAFVRLPDGTTQVLGSLLISSRGGTSLTCGPFTQKGTYTFGISVEEGTSLSSHLKVGYVEINVNGSTVDTHDFLVPAHPSANYEPHPCEYTLP